MTKIVGIKLFLSIIMVTICIGLTACSKNTPASVTINRTDSISETQVKQSENTPDTSYRADHVQSFSDDSVDGEDDHEYYNHEKYNNEIYNNEKAVPDNYAEYHENTDVDSFEYNIAKPIRLFSDYSKMRPFYSDIVAGAYGEQFSISMRQAAEYERYLEEHGYSLDQEAWIENADRYIGLADDDWIYVTDHGGSVSFLYGGDVRLEGTDGTVTTVIVGDQQNYGYSYSNAILPDTSMNNGSLCPVCGGNGKVICKGCNGLGYLPSIKHSADYGYGSSVYEAKNHCYSCGGSGQSICTHCFGTGRIQ